MRKFVLDTNIVLHYLRASQLSKKIEAQLSLLDPTNILMISSVTLGELEGFMQRNEWGQAKTQRMKALINRFIVIDVSAADADLMKAYATIWNYSKNALPSDKLGKSVGIGQNDVWIAALARTAGAELVTTDGDFDHLHGKWVNVHKFAV